MKLDDNDPLYSEWSNGAPKVAPSLSPHELHVEEPESYPRTSPEHRARLRRYVKGTVAVCVALCTTAIVRVALSHLLSPGDEGSPPSRFAAAQLGSARETPPESPPSGVTQAAFPPVAAAAPVPLRTITSSATLSPAKTAYRDRETARRALEAGKPKDALAAAERATVSDPADAEGWLILGAAHGELGHVAAARDAFRSCARSAKRGPVRECAAMLR
jgi:hypothetical protein